MKAAHNGDVIFGLGTSGVLAIQDAARHTNNIRGLKVEACTDRLAEAIVKHGGNTPWTYRNGLMDTEE